MLFTSFSFFVLLLITFILYYIPLFKRQQVLILIVSSLFFYAYHTPYLLILLSVSIIFNALLSFGLYWKGEKEKKKHITYAVIANLSILGFFKYSGLIGTTFFPESELVNLLMLIPLPIGISFYTFEGISLLIDSSKNSFGFQKDKSFLNFLRDITLFISFFPHLIAGPILKANDFLPQIKSKIFNEIKWDEVIRLLITGYFFKVVIADNLNDLTTEMLVPRYHSSITLLTLMFGYSMQIFSDFAGYSLIAIGLGKMFGYSLPQNFNFPYISQSFSEFWRRWHISLSSFLKEYLYISLGGNRKGEIRTYFNLFLVMLLGGLWHGAGWSYAIWGSFHGLALAAERFINSNLLPKINIANKGMNPQGATLSIFILNRKIKKLLNILLVFTFVSIAWLLFRLPDFSAVLTYLEQVRNNFAFAPVVNISLAIPIFILSIPVILYHVYHLAREADPDLKLISIVRSINPLLLAVMLLFILCSSGRSGEFIYFQF